MIDLTGLNPQQREAVTHGEGPLLVLAGAGSGKTRVITYRIAWLIGELGVHPTNILAVTFTNKAASEMVSRVGHLVPGSGARAHGSLWIGTFHSTSLRMLRRYADRLGYTKSFAVYDTSDQLTLVRRCMRELQMNDEAFPPRSILNRISASKNELIGPAEYEKENLDFFGSRVAEVYRMYQRRLKEYDAMDFDDLIGNYVALIEKNEDIAEEIHNRFQHLLIDEYQDTNRAQYMLIKALAGKQQNIVAVGDEDQSIYKFRGADINNILNFERDFPGARIIKLEQNYRSTGNILDAATGVVANNIARKGKTLFTDSGSGEPVRVVTCSNEREEAQFVIDKMTSMRGRYKLSDYAILFRTNAQSRPFEEELLRGNIPYSVVGGVKFYERAEIKDVLSFLRLAIRPHDTPSIERVINVPSRGIGDTTMKALNDQATAQNVTLWTVIEGDLSFLPPRASKAVKEFREIVHDLQRAANNPLPELYDYLLLRTGYRRMLHGIARRAGRIAPAEHRRNDELRARVFGAEPGRDARRLPRLADADVGSRQVRIAERRHADDAARGEGAGVQSRLPHRDGGRNPAAFAVEGCERGSRGGAPPLLRRHDARPRAALVRALPGAAAARAVSRAESVAVHHRDSGERARGSAHGPRALRAGCAVVARAADAAGRSLQRPLLRRAATPQPSSYSRPASPPPRSRRRLPRRRRRARTTPSTACCRFSKSRRCNSIRPRSVRPRRRARPRRSNAASASATNSSATARS